MLSKICSSEMVLYILLIHVSVALLYKVMYLNDSNTFHLLIISLTGFLKEPEISPLQLCLENVHRTLQRSVNILHQ